MGTTKDLPEKIILAGLVLLVFLLPIVFYLPAHDPYCTPRMWLARTITVLSLAGLVLVSTAREKTKLNKPLITLPVLFFLIVTVVSTIFSLHFYTSFFGDPVFFYGLTNLLNGIVLFFVFINIIKDNDQRQWLINSLLLGSSVVAFYALCQRLDFPFLYTYYSMAMFDPRRVDSTFGNPAFLSMYLMLLLPLAIHQLLSHLPPKSSTQRLVNWLLFLLVNALVFSVVATYSRAAWIGMALELFLLFFVYRRRLDLTALITSGMVLLIAAGLYFVTADRKTPSVSERLTSLAHVEAFKGRETMWKYSLPMVRDFSLLGAGPGAFRYAFYQNYIPLDWEEVGEAHLTVVEPHNYLLQLACEHGLLGLLAFLWLIISFFLMTFGKLREKRRREAGFLSPALAVSIAGFLVVAATTMLEITNLIFFWVFLALAVWSGKDFQETSFRWNKTAAKIGQAVAVLAALGLLILSSNYAKADVYYGSGASVVRSKAFSYLDYGAASLQSSIACFPYNSEIYRELGNLYLNAFQNTGNADYLWPTMAAFEQAIKVNPYDYEAWSSLGKTCLFVSAQRDKSVYLEKTREIYQYLLTTRFDRPYIHYMLGRVYAEEEKDDRAIEEWNRSIGLDPEYIAPYLGLFSVYQKKEDLTKATQIYQKARKINPENPVVKEWGRALNQ